MKEVNIKAKEQQLRQLQAREKLCTFMIKNSKYEEKFLSREDGIAFIKKNCRYLTTHLFRKVDDKWVPAGMIWADNQI